MDKEQLQKRLDEIKKSMPREVSYPPTPEMLKNAAKSIINNAQSVMNGNSLSATSQESLQRLNVCRSCEFFDYIHERCKKCGCKLALKTYLKAEKCPIGKW